MLGILPQDGTQGLELFATLRFNYTSAVDVTEHPVESATDITDNWILKPVTATFDVRISDSDDRTFGLVDFGTVGDLVEYAAGDGEPSKSETIYNEVKRLKEDGVIVWVAWERELLTDCLITYMSITDTPDTTDGIAFTMSVKQVTFVDSESTEIPEPAEEIADSAASTKDKGKKTTKPATEEQEAAAEEQERSFAKQIFGG